MSSETNTLSFNETGSEGFLEAVRVADFPWYPITILMILSFLGTVPNVINIIVFSKMKSKEAINITLLGLAVSDMLVCFLSFITSFGLQPFFANMLLRNKWNPTDVIYYTFGMPQTFFARITIVHTALITIERCLCVVFPLKVKTIITRGRVRAAVVIAYILGFSVAIHNYATTYLGMAYYPLFNTTLLTLIVTEKFLVVGRWQTPLDVLFFYAFLYFLITICTVILIRSLKDKMNWRSNANATTSGNSMKEKRVVKMVVIISSVFMFCYFPNSIFFLTTTFYPDNTVRGKHVYTMMFVTWAISVLQVFNAAMNLFIYYNNSSRFKETFDRLFLIKRAKKDEESK